MKLELIVQDILAALVAVDSCGLPFKNFKPGVGPYGEPQLLKLIASYLNSIPRYESSAITKRTPDLLIPGKWAIEFKIARPYGDNGREAEDWSVNLLHPYPGNVSSIGDCIKLLKLDGDELRAIVVIGYEHSPAKINLTPLIDSFETIARNVMNIALAPRIEICKEGLTHPVHRVVRVFAWEVLRISEVFL